MLCSILLFYNNYIYYTTLYMNFIYTEYAIPPPYYYYIMYLLYTILIILTTTYCYYYYIDGRCGANMSTSAEYTTLYVLSTLLVK